MAGFALAYRNRWAHPLFKSRAEAAVWAWITDTAAWVDGTIDTCEGPVDLKRGQIVISLRWISDQFEMDRKRVRRLIERMVDAGMLVKNGTTNGTTNGTASGTTIGTTYAVVNYDKYQALEKKSTKSGTTSGAANGTTNGTANGTTIKEDNKPTTEQDSDSSLRSESCRSEIDEGEPAQAELKVVSIDEHRQGRSKQEVEEAVRLYGIVAERRGLPKVSRMTPERKTKIRLRLDECGGLEGWKDALRKLDKSPHCCGDNQRGWRANLDFLLQPSSFTKLVEGFYDGAVRRAEHERPMTEQAGVMGAGARVAARMRAQRAAAGGYDTNGGPA